MKIVHMSEKRIGSEPRYAFLDPVVDLLLASGNELATEYRWGSNPTGYFCLMRHPLDLGLVAANFDLPPSVVLDQKFGAVDYGMGTVVIRQE